MVNLYIIFKIIFYLKGNTQFGSLSIQSQSLLGLLLFSLDVSPSNFPEMSQIPRAHFSRLLKNISFFIFNIFLLP